MARHKQQPDRRRSRGAPAPFPVKRNGVIERYACDVELPKLPGGTRNRQRVYGKTEAECLAAVRRLLVARDEGEERITNAPTFKTYCEWWLETVKAPKVAPQTLESYRETLSRHAYPAIGEKPLHKVSTEQLQTLLARVFKAAPGTVEKLAVLLNAVFGYAVSARPQRRKDNPMVGVDVPEHAARPSRPLTAAELAKLTAALAGHRFEGAYWLSICGLRPAEVCGAQWASLHLDDAEPYIEVRHQVVRTKAGLQLTEILKTDKSRRRVYLVPQAVAALRQQRARDAAMLLESGRRSPQVVIPTRKPLMDPGTLWRYFKPILKAAGLPAEDIHLHDLRASYATLAHAAGAPLRDVQAQLGHSTPATTMKFYTHATDDGQKDVARRVGKKLGDKTGS